MSRAVGRCLVFAAVLLLAPPLAASARPIEGTPAPRFQLEQVWTRVLEWFGTVVPKAVWGEQGTDVDPYGRPVPVPLQTDGGSAPLL